MIARLTRCFPFSFVAALALAACSSPSVPGMAPGSFSSPSPSSGGLAGLVGQSNVISAEEAELRDIQRRPTAIVFPARVGVLFYEYADPLKNEDHQAAVDKLGRELLATGLVTSAAEIPSNLVRPRDSLDTLRKLAARFQVDVLLLVSGSHEFTRSGTQPAAGLFGGNSEANFDARSTVTGLAIGVFSGTFLTPFQVVGTVNNTKLSTDASDYAAKVYALEKTAHEAALVTLKARFVETLTQAKQTQDAAPPPTPTPVPTATPSAAASADPSASPAASAEPTPSPTAP